MVQVNIELRGPAFRKGLKRPTRATLHRAVEDLVEMGEQRLDQILRPRPAGVFLSVQQAARGKASTGHYRRNVHGRVQGLQGVIDDGKVVYGPWLEGISSRNATTRFKGYASFRRVGQWLDRQTPKVLRRHIGRLVRELNG